MNLQVQQRPSLFWATWARRHKGKCHQGWQQHKNVLIFPIKLFPSYLIKYGLLIGLNEWIMTHTPMTFSKISSFWIENETNYDFRFVFCPCYFICPTRTRAPAQTKNSWRTSLSLRFVNKRKIFDKPRRTRPSRFANFWPRGKKQTGILRVRLVSGFA